MHASIKHINERRHSLTCACVPSSWHVIEGVKQVPYADQPTAQGTQCRKIPFPDIVNFCIQRTVSELQGVKFPQFSHFFAYFSHTKRLKYLFVRGLQLRGYTAECFRLFPVVVEGPKGCVVLVGFFMRRMVGELGPPNLPKLRLWKMAINGTYTVRLHGASDLDQTRTYEHGCAFWRCEQRFPKVSESNRENKFWAHAYDSQAWTIQIKTRT